MGFYTGFVWLFPFALTVAAWFLGAKFLPKDRHLFLPAYSFQVGQMLWFITGGVVSHTLAPVDILEGLVLAATAGWLLVKPNLAAIVTVAVIQGLSILVNFTGLQSEHVGSTAHKILALTIVWRGATLVLLFDGYFKLRGSGKALAP